MWTSRLINTNLIFFVIYNSEESGKNGHHEKMGSEHDFEEVKGHKKKQYDESG